MADDYIRIWDGELDIIVPRGTPWPEIEKRIERRHEYLAYQKVRSAFLATHGPWDFPRNMCMSCKETLTHIQHNRSICSGNTKTETGKK